MLHKTKIFLFKSFEIKDFGNVSLYYEFIYIKIDLQILLNYQNELYEKGP